MSTHLNKETDDTNYFCVGLNDPKNAWNIGGAIRAIGCFDGSMLVCDGERFKKCKCDFRYLDTDNIRKKIPIILGLEDLSIMIPVDCEPVIVEIKENSESLVNFEHPRRAFYIFGPEDGSVKNYGFKNRKSVSIPSNGCLNLAACVNVVLYDRKSKEDNFKTKVMTCTRCGSDHCKYNEEYMLYHCNSCGFNF